jgi:hypothetical protein
LRTAKQLTIPVQSSALNKVSYIGNLGSFWIQARDSISHQCPKVAISPVQDGPSVLAGLLVPICLAHFLVQKSSAGTLRVGSQATSNGLAQVFGLVLDLA